MKNTGMLIDEWVKFENPTSNVLKKQNIFWNKKFAILHCTHFPLPPIHSLQEKQFFLGCTKIIEEDTSTPHTPFFRLSQMYHNRYMPVFASVNG